MSKPKSFDSWPPEKQAEWRRTAAARSKASREKKIEEYREKSRIRDAKRWAENPEKGKELNKIQYQKHKDKRAAKNRAKVKEWTQKHPKRAAANKARWEIENRDTLRPKRREIARRVAAKITDSYLASCKLMTVAHLRKYPRQVIEMWKALLILTRSCRKPKTN